MLVPQPAIMEKQKQWDNTTVWWIFVSGEKLIDTANYHERTSQGSNIPNPHTVTLSPNSCRGSRETQTIVSCC